MPNLAPHNNVLLGYISGLISVLLINFAKAVGYDVPDSITAYLPMAIFAIMPHIGDIVTDWWRKRMAKP